MACAEVRTYATFDGGCAFATGLPCCCGAIERTSNSPPSSPESRRIECRAGGPPSRTFGETTGGGWPAHSELAGTVQVPQVQRYPSRLLPLKTRPRHRSRREAHLSRPPHSAERPAYLLGSACRPSDLPGGQARAVSSCRRPGLAQTAPRRRTLERNWHSRSFGGCFADRLQNPKPCRGRSSAAWLSSYGRRRCELRHVRTRCVDIRSRPGKHAAIAQLVDEITSRALASAIWFCLYARAGCEGAVGRDARGLRRHGPCPAE